MSCVNCVNERYILDWCDECEQFEEEEECSPYCSQGSLPIDEEPCEVCRRNEK